VSDVVFFLQVIAERETTVRLVAERESLKTQLCTAQTTHTELEAALKDAERRLLETLAALESQKDEFNAKERADAETAETLRRMKEAQSDKETDFARLRTSLAESQATIASLNAAIEGTHATHAREIERLNDELTAERTKVTSSARDVEELTKKLAQSESESVAFNQSAHTEKLQLQKRLEDVNAESNNTIAELTAEVSRLSALVDGAETNVYILTLVRAI
jgi:small-conductance mechanosensitive channel